MSSTPCLLTIRELLEVVKSTISDLPRYTICGVVIEASLSRGHMYFTLTDGNSAVSCIVWQKNSTAIQRVKVGAILSCTGRVDFYAVRGKISMVVTSIVNSKSESELELEPIVDPVEATRNRLLEQRLCVGMTESNQPRSLPSQLGKIAVITAVVSAAWQDLRCTLNEKNLDSLLVPYDCLVQGDGAPSAIAQKISELGEKYTILCIVRGGGSSSDLAAFSHDVVLRACIDFRNRSSSHIIICGVGHEIDHPLVELVSDIVRRTPTMVGNAISEHVASESNKRRTTLDKIHRDLEAYYTKRFMDFQALLCKTNTIRANRASIDSIHQGIVLGIGRRLDSLLGLKRQADDLLVEHQMDEIRRSTCVLLDSKLAPFDIERLPTTYTHAVLSIGDRRINIKFKVMHDP